MNLPLGDLKAGLSKRTIREQIADKLTAMIGSGLLREGDELPSERDLASTLDVSRETIRGAIQVLAALGMIEIAHGSRSRVTERSRWIGAPIANGNLQNYLPEEIYRARKVVEVAVAQAATLAIKPSVLAHLHQLVDAQADMHDDPIAFQISDIEFHALIYEAGGNRLLKTFLTDVYGYALDLRRRALLVPNAVKRSWLDHGRIIAAFDARDPAAAGAAVARHLARVHRTTQLADRDAKRETVRR